MRTMLVLVSILFFAAVVKPQSLPVELVYFEAIVQANSVLLIFGTATEQDNYGFEIQRSDSSGIWDTIGFVSKPPSNSNVPKDYEFEDTSITANNIYYYRLKQLDLSGGFEYSWEDTVIVDFITSVETSQIIITNFSLDQNYPNPFNPLTNFGLQIGNAGFVTLKIYDVLGRVLAVLINEHKPAGRYNIEFDGIGLSSGIYFYKLEAGSFTDTKKFLLLK
ncbi:MAG: T9SS type A sorting domain-containing protein [Ignavibacteriaceae bacterium]